VGNGKLRYKLKKIKVRPEFWRDLFIFISLSLIVISVGAYAAILYVSSAW